MNPHLLPSASSAGRSASASVSPQALAAVVVLSLVAAACSPSEPEPTPDPTPTPTVPAAPTVHAVAGDGQVTLTWEDVDGADSYVAYFGTAAPDVLDAETSDRIDPASSPQVIDGLQNGVEYRFAVAARNEAGEGEWSTIVVATPAAALLPPSAPTDVTATPADAQVTVSWSPVDGADGYELFWSDTSPLDRDTATRVAPVTSPHVVSGLTNDRTYHFAVIATNQAGASAWSDEASATPTAPETAPAPPANVTATAGDGEVTVTWDPVPSATSYDVLYTDADALSDATADLATRLADVTSPLVITELTNDTTYRFAVIARNAIGDSALSDVVSATPEALILPPEPPANVVATAGDETVIVTWDPVASATSYDLLYTDDEELTDATAARLTDVASPVELADLTNGTTYLFAVIAVNEAGPGAPSVPVAATPLPPLPHTPGEIALISGDTTLQVMFTGDALADSHELFYGTESPLTEDNATRVDGISNPYTLTGLVNGTTYYVRIRSRNLAGVSELSSEASATPLPPPPAAPTDVTVEPGGYHLEVSWNSDPLADSHRVYVSKTSPLVPHKAEVRLDDVTSPVRVTDLMPWTRYYVTVVSFRMGNPSPYSEEAEGTPLAPKPEAPSDVAVVAGDGALTVTWTDAGWAASQDLYYGTESPVSEANATRVEDVTSPHTITGLTNGTRYFVALVSHNESGSSGFSDEADGTPLTAPAAPTGLTATPGMGAVELDWTVPATAESHSIYYRAGAEPEIDGPGTIRLSPVQPPYTVTGLDNGTTYHFVVTSTNSAGQSPPSGSVQATPIDRRALVRGVWPFEGLPAGGIEIIVSGRNFEHGTTPRLYFGDVEATDVTVVSDELLTVVVPPSVASGWTALRTVNDEGEVVREYGFMYSPYPGAARIEHALTTPVVGPDVATGDFNSDGHVDVAVLSDTTSSSLQPGRLEVVFGDGAGGVIGSTVIDAYLKRTGTGLIAADFDGDGHLDLAAAHSQHVQVHYGTGGGDFDSGVPVEGMRPSAIAAGDFDGDGRLELIVSNRSPSTQTDHAATILASAGREWTEVLALPRAENHVGVVVGHFNADEDDDLDFAIASDVSQGLYAPLTVYLRDDSVAEAGDAFGFRAGTTFDYTYNATGLGLVATDLDGDGRDDVAVAGRELHVFLQQADGSFEATKRNVGNVPLSDLEAADLDGDGFVDLVMTDSARAEIAILYASAPGVFDPAVAVALPQSVDGCALADVDGNGTLDLVAAGGSTNQSALTYLLNAGPDRYGDGTESLSLIANVLRPQAALAGKLLGDKDAVALIGGSGANSWIRLFEIVDGSLAAPVSVKAGTEPTRAALGDFDGDGRLDVVMNSKPQKKITVVTNLGPSAPVTDVEVPGWITDLAADDLNDDGYADVVATSPAFSQVYVGINDQAGGFTFTTVEQKANHLALGDFDGDGDLDVAVDDTLGTAFLWNDDGTFTLGETGLWIGHTVRRVQTGDVDGDGWTDLLVLAEGDDGTSPDRLVVFRNDGDGTWTQATYDVGHGAAACALGDGDGDGITDVFVTNTVSGTVSFLQGGGTGTFLPQHVFGGGGSPSGIALYDADGDGKATVYTTGNHTRGSLTAVHPR